MLIVFINVALLLLGQFQVYGSSKNKFNEGDAHGRPGMTRRQGGLPLATGVRTPLPSINLKMAEEATQSDTKEGISQSRPRSIRPSERLKNAVVEQFPQFGAQLSSQSESLLVIPARPESIRAVEVMKSSEFQYIKREHVYRYLRKFLDLFPPPFDFSIDTLVERMNAHNRAKFVTSLGGGVKVFQSEHLGTLRLGVPHNNRLLDYIVAAFDSLETRKDVTAEGKSALAAWGLFRLTADILATMERDNPWGKVCTCMECVKGERALMERLTNNHAVGLDTLVAKCGEIKAAINTRAEMQYSVDDPPPPPAIQSSSGSMRPSQRLLLRQSSERVKPSDRLKNPS